MTQSRKMALFAAVAGVAALLVVGSVLSGKNAPSQPSGPAEGSRDASAASAVTSTVQTTASSAPASTSQPPKSAPVPASGDDGPKPTPVFDPEPLKKIDIAPSRTLAFVTPPAAADGDAYDVVFVPYGFGPGGGRGSLVVRIEQSEPVGTPKRSYQLRGRNVTLATGERGGGQQVERGGTYRGTVVFKRREGVLVPTLENVR